MTTASAGTTPKPCSPQPCPAPCSRNIDPPPTARGPHSGARSCPEVDGVRAVAPGGLVPAHSRTEQEITRSYPELRGSAQLVEQTVLLDGELVATVGERYSWQSDR